MGHHSERHCSFPGADLLGELDGTTIDIQGRQGLLASCHTHTPTRTGRRSICSARCLLLRQLTNTVGNPQRNPHHRPRHGGGSVHPEGEEDGPQQPAADAEDRRQHHERAVSLASLEEAAQQGLLLRRHHPGFVTCYRRRGTQREWPGAHAHTRILLLVCRKVKRR